MDSNETEIKCKNCNLSFNVWTLPTLPTETITCSECGTTHVLVQSDPIRIAQIGEDDAGKYIELSYGFHNVFKQCKICEKEIETGEKIYVFQNHSYKRDDVLCKRCRRKKTVVEAL